jgi:molybdenum cofactor cytidylyltransferase
MTNLIMVNVICRKKGAMVSAIVLAAGESKRLGRPKLLLPLGNSTILEQTIDNLLSSKVSEVVVVVGYSSEEMTRIIVDRPVKIAVNPIYKRGMSTSIITGLNLVNNKSDAIMIMLADQPFIGSRIINKLIREFIDNNKGIVFPTYQSNQGHPVIFATKYKAELLKLEGDVGAREIIKKHANDILEIAVNSESVYVDIDTVSDYYRALKSLSK